MTREEAKALLYNISAYDIDAQRGIAKQEAIEIAIKALEQEPCWDAISRQAVIDAISRIGLCKCSTKEVQAVDECLRAVENLPSVSTEKIGRWINDSCSICNYGVQPWNNTPYCPNCGSYNGGTEKCQ